ncbi:MAG TPA: protoglobin domain-containing protein [Vicinamibacterales bacterium]|nr:protoglobin domain-containing protein [Vicinamibacterales bacterium]
MAKSFLEEMKRYIGFTADDAAMLASLAPIIEPHIPALADRFYAQIPRHTEAAAVFTGGETQIARLKLTLQRWARGLFSGTYDTAYAEERFRIGDRHVQIRLPQRYVIGAMQVVAEFLREILDREISDEDRRRRAHTSVSRILLLDLNLMCETYFEGSLRELRQLNDRLSTVNRSLEEANRAKSDFLATTSHELRTPLTSIIGFSRLLLDQYVADPAEQHDLLADLHRNALHLLTLVEDILDVSRIEAGRLDMASDTVDLAALIVDVAALTNVQAADKGLALFTDVLAELPRVRVDQSRLRQILLNVIGNAIKFTDRGEVRIAAARESDGSGVRVEVTDTGIGIPPEKQSLLFEKFRQVDASHTRRHGGAGLGLAISKALIEIMNGRISLRSEGMGKGTTVTLVVPVTAPAQAVARTTDQSGTRTALTSVLVIAEDPDARTSLGAALASAGYFVRDSASVDRAKALVRTERPDVLLIDLTTARRAETAREWLDWLVALHADPDTRSIRPVVLTDPSLGAATCVQFELLASRPTVIQKPLDPDGLTRALKRVASEPRTVPFRLLVADDDPLVFKFVTGVLPPHEYVVLRAGTGNEVLHAVRTQHIDAVLLDLRMPDGSGYDVIRSLKLEGHAPDVPILVLTNYPAPTDLDEQNLLSAPLVLDVLPKPSVAKRPDLLLERLEMMRRKP